MKKISFCLIFILASLQISYSEIFSESKKRRIDSLNNVINNPYSNDTAVATSLQFLSSELYASNRDTLIPLGNKTIAVVDKALSKKTSIEERESLLGSKGSALVNIGLINKKKGNVTLGIEYYIQALEIFEEIGSDEGIGLCLNNLGAAYRYLGQMQDALEAYNRSLKIREKIGDKDGISGTLNNLAVLYSLQGDEQTSLEYYERSLEIRIELDDKLGIANSYSNIGKHYKDRLNYDVALDYYSKAETLYLELGFESGLGDLYNLFGGVYEDTKDYKKANEYFLKGLTYRRSSGNKNGIANSLNNLAVLEFKQGNIVQSEKYAEEALHIANELGNPYLIQHAASTLFKTNENRGNHKTALEMYKLHILMRDSVLNLQTQKNTAQQIAKYEYEKKAAADSVEYANLQKIQQSQLEAELAKSEQLEAEAKSKKLQGYFLFGGLILALIFGGFIYNRFKITQKQNKIIEDKKNEVEMQKAIVETKNDEILASINYAQRIQNAILPTEDFLSDALKDHFILYMPKDIVAGDFYWIEKLGDDVLFAAADCTGHGVPGAMVSVVCHNALNRSVREFKLTDPGEILDKTRELVIEQFLSNNEQVKDGMDIALCKLNETHLEFAGANNPLWILRKGSNEIEEIKGDKQPIGAFSRISKFNTHKCVLQKGDRIYIFTDGFADQFGGIKGKKFKYSSFKKLLVENALKTNLELKNTLSVELINWKGDLEQVDDICIIGITI